MVTKEEEKTEEPRHCSECARIFVAVVGSRRMYCDSCMAKRVGEGRPPKPKTPASA